MMFEKGKRERRQSEDDKIFNRMLLWLAGAVVVELLILLVKKAYVDSAFGISVMVGLAGVLKVFSIAGAVLLAGAVIWAVLWARSGKPVTLPAAIAGGLAILWVIALVSYLLFDAGMQLLMMLPAAGAVLILIYFLYQRSFFLSAMITGGGVMALWVFRQHYMDHPRAITIGFVAGFLLLAAAAGAAFLLNKGDGKLGRVRVMPVDSNYLMVFASCAVTAVTMVLALILGVNAALYLLFVLMGWLFVQAVFFTVKMM